MNCLPDEAWHIVKKAENSCENHLVDKDMATFGRVRFTVETATAEVAEGYLADVEPKVGHEFS